MQTQALLSSLEDLQSELERLAPAVNHIEAAQRVTDTVNQLPGQHQTTLDAITSEFRDIVTSHRAELHTIQEDLKDRQQQTLETLATTAATTMQDAGASAAELRKRIGLEMIDMRKRLTDTARQMHAEVYSEVERQTKATEAAVQAAISDNVAAREQGEQALTALRSQIEEATKNLQSELHTEAAAIKGLRDQIATYLEKIEAINFPVRLEKLDASVAGILAATQTTQSRLNDVERNVNERVGQAQAAAKQARVYALMTLIAVVLGGGGILATLLFR